jgi:teichuronic acid biosynthesis glycosyltransferase TuaH
MKSNSLIFLVCDTPWLWSVDYANQTAIELSRNNLVICYLSADVITWSQISKYRFILKKYCKNLYLYCPFYIIPINRYRFGKLNLFLNITLVKFLMVIVTCFKKFKRKIFWVFDPNLANIYNFFGKSYLLLYDCVDFFTASNTKYANKTMETEKYVTKTANIVVANSRVLQKHLRKYRKNVSLVPQGFRMDDFTVKKGKYIDLKLKKPVIGFVGGINNRLNTTLLLSLIKNNPKWNFVLWGPIQKDLPTGSDRLNEINKILKLPNVKTGKSDDKKEIPGIISQFDIGIIPYDVTQDFNKFCYPMKVFEYFYLGKPVVSTNIVELHRFPKFVKIGNSAQDWEEIIKNLLLKKWSKKNIGEEKKVSEANNWKNKIRTIIEHI